MGQQQSPLFNDNKLKLGFFSPNCSSGMSVTKVAERWDNSWDNNIELAMLRGRFAAGHGTYPFVGDPDSVAKEMAKVTEAGFAGCTISFVDYVKEFPYFRDEVLPRLEKMGLRSPV